ncbi:MAG: hypothetical protein H6732_18130 [Alphaproteobacteria bacterium]|nr:hypothetical protein [Alphaproteobacteria bacterium]
MARLGGELDETWRVAAPLDVVRAQVHDLERHRTAVAEAERVDRPADDVLRFVLTEQRHGPYAIQPDYTVRYRVDGDDLAWETLEGNFDSRGRASLSAAGGVTLVRWQHAIGFDLPVPGLVAAGLRPVVNRLMVPGIRRYADGVLLGLPRA